jgi:hypothetical protein
VIDNALRERLVAMTADFKHIWTDTSVANRERKRMLAHVIEDATLLKNTEDGTITIHIRFKGGRTETLTTRNPKPSWQKVKTSPEIVALVDELLEDNLYSEIADVLNAKGLHPGGAAWPGKHNSRFTALRVQYLVHTYGLRSRFDRLRKRGMLTKKEMAARLKIHEHTLVRWVEYGIIKAHAYTKNRWLYEEPKNLPKKHCSRWDRLIDRAAATSNPASKRTRHASRTERGAV